MVAEGRLLVQLKGQLHFTDHVPPRLKSKLTCHSDLGFATGKDGCTERRRSTQHSMFSELALEVETPLSPDERRRGAGRSSLAAFRSTLLVGSDRGGRNAVEEWIEEVGEASGQHPFGASSEEGGRYTHWQPERARRSPTRHH